MPSCLWLPLPPVLYFMYAFLVAAQGQDPHLIVSKPSYPELRGNRQKNCVLWAKVRFRFLDLALIVVRLLPSVADFGPLLQSRRIFRPFLAGVQHGFKWRG